jgi:hypothetical protein
MAYRAAQNAFSGGEIGRQVRARDDTQKYKGGLDLALNILLLPAGGFYNRPGFRFAAQLKNSTSLGRLFPAAMSLNQAYALELTDGLMRVYYDGGLVLRPELIVTGATNTNPLTVTIPDSGYEIGWDIYFTGQLGMTELNGLTLTITNIVGDVVTFGSVDATDWGVWTGSTGGVAGDAGGGSGGVPPPEPDDPLPPVDDDEPPPPTCVWAESWLLPGLMAGAAVTGSPLRRMTADGSSAFPAAVDANMAAYAPGYRLVTARGSLTVSDTAPVPVANPAGEYGFIFVKGMAVDVGAVVPTEALVDGEWVFDWEPVLDIVFVGMIRVAKIQAGDGVYGAGDQPGFHLFTHNIRYKPDVLYLEP